MVGVYTVYYNGGLNAPGGIGVILEGRDTVACSMRSNVCSSLLGVGMSCFPGSDDPVVGDVDRVSRHVRKGDGDTISEVENITRVDGSYLSGVGKRRGSGSVSSSPSGGYSEGDYIPIDCGHVSVADGSISKVSCF